MGRPVLVAFVALLLAGCSSSGTLNDDALLNSSTTNVAMLPAVDDSCVEVHRQLVEMGGDRPSDFSQGGQWNPAGDDSEGVELDPDWVDSRLVPTSGVAIDDDHLVTARGDELLVVDLTPGGLIRSVRLEADPDLDSYFAFIGTEGDTATIVEPGLHRTNRWPGMPALGAGYPAVAVRWIDLETGDVIEERQIEGSLWSVEQADGGLIDLIVHAPFGGNIDPERSATDEIATWLPSQRQRQADGGWSEPTPVAECSAIEPAGKPDARILFRLPISHDATSPVLADEVTLLDAANTPRQSPTIRAAVADPTFFDDVDIIELTGDRILAVGVYVTPDKVTFRTQFKYLQNTTDSGTDSTGFITDEPAAVQYPLRYSADHEIVVAPIVYLDQADPQRAEFMVFDVSEIEAPRLRGAIQHDPYWTCDDGDHQLASTLAEGPLGTNCRQQAALVQDIIIDNERIITVTNTEIRVQNLATLELISATSFLNR